MTFVKKKFMTSADADLTFRDTYYKKKSHLPFSWIENQSNKYLGTLKNLA